MKTTRNTAQQHFDPKIACASLQRPRNGGPNRGAGEVLVGSRRVEGEASPKPLYIPRPATIDTRKFPTERREGTGVRVPAGSAAGSMPGPAAATAAATTRRPSRGGDEQFQSGGWFTASGNSSEERGAVKISFASGGGRLAAAAADEVGRVRVALCGGHWTQRRSGALQQRDEVVGRGLAFDGRVESDRTDAETMRFWQGSVSLDGGPRPLPVLRESPVLGRAAVARRPR